MNIGSILKIILTLVAIIFFPKNVSAVSGIYPQNIENKIKQTFNFENFDKPVVIPSQSTFYENPLECIPSSLDILVKAFFKGDSKSIDCANTENNRMISHIEKVSKQSASHLYLKADRKSVV